MFTLGTLIMTMANKMVIVFIIKGILSNVGEKSQWSTYLLKNLSRLKEETSVQMDKIGVRYNKLDLQSIGSSPDLQR